MTYFLDLPATNQMYQTAIKSEAWKLFHATAHECALYKGAHLLAEKYFLEVDEGFILETVIEKPEKETVDCYA